MLALIALIACDSTEPPPKQGAFRMLTYNVQGLPDTFTNSTRPTPERMEVIAPLLEDFDVVGLQEDFSDEGHALLTDTSHEHRAWFSSTVEDRVYGSGLSLLSRTPWSDYSETHYDQCHGVLDSANDCLASKGFQAAVYDLGGRPFHVLNTHHEAGGGPEDDAARRSQVEQVIAYIDAHPDEAVLLMGDTNLRPSDPEDVDELQLYADAGLEDGCDLTACPEDDHIDRFLLRSGAGLELSAADWGNLDPTFTFPEGDPMSDHPPIALSIDWLSAE